MPPVLVLFPSPLLGPAVWEPVAARLSAAGRAVAAPVAVGAALRTPDDVLRAFTAGLPAADGLVLIAHSNAGLYLPALTAVRRVTGLLFVDAGLPGREGPVRTGPPTFREFLGPKADDAGLLPPWSRWWDDVTHLFPDEPTRHRVEREQQRLPLSYFEQTIDVPSGWTDVPGAYLAFGDTYRTDRERALQRGWPVATIPHAGHLHMLMEPGRVAAEMESLLDAIGITEPDS